LPKTTLLYNFHRLTQPLTQPIVVVECPWAVMRLAQLAIPAVALLGTQLSPQQQRLLLPAPRLILMLDGDVPGRLATARLADTLASTTSVHPIFLPDGLDPDDLSDRQLRHLLRPFLF
jgi:DNA primase